jgi:hypothetical protein
MGKRRSSSTGVTSLAAVTPELADIAAQARTS